MGRFGYDAWVTISLPARSALALRVDEGRLDVLDQRLLPDVEQWIDVREVSAMVDAIKGLAVRGAPLLGVAAACSLAFRAAAGDSAERLVEAAHALRNARPTAVNLHAAVDAMLASLDLGGPDTLVDTALAWFEADVQMCEMMAANGAAYLADGDGVLTHCNTGGLATAGIGTALGVILRAHQSGKRLHVYVDETRPLLQGGRLTAWELERAGVPYTLLTDSMAALVLRDGKARKCFVGADRIARNGDSANKVGTYGLAVQARHHGADFYVVAPWTTVDLLCPTGASIEIEARDATEVRGMTTAAGSLRWAPAASTVMNPAFDVTPVSLITAHIFDRGAIQSSDLALVPSPPAW